MTSSRRVTRITVAAALALALAAPPARPDDAAAPADPAGSAIRVYQRHLSAMRHVRCRFSPSCSQYAAEAIAAHGLVEGSARAADRLMRCNAGSETRYARGGDGLLVDPADGSGAGPVAVRVPPWLLPRADGERVPAAASLASDRRARLEETLEFARRLERRGDCERASAEYQRAGVLADTLAADAWAYDRIAGCYFGASQWYFADRAWLTSAMLSQDPARRAAAGYAAAASRFNAGGFVACSRLLADSALAAPGDGAPRWRVPALAGLGACALGDWPAAESAFGRAAEAADDADARQRVMLLSAFAHEGAHLPRRSPGLAAAMSAVLPGAGQAYGGHPRDGLRHLLFNAALVYTVASLADAGHVPAAVLAGTVALPFYLGNVLGARDAADRFNRERRMRHLERALAASGR